MPRARRIDVPHLPQHVVLRGHNRQGLFETPQDRFVAMRYIEEALATRGCEMHAYVLMTNHLHLLLRTRAAGDMSHFMHGWSRRYAMYFNRTRGRSGAVYEGRFRSDPVKTDHYFFACMRYIELNPLRAKMVQAPWEYPWSSFRQNASGSPGAPITPHPAYAALGRTPARRAKAYAELFALPVPAVEMETLRAGIRPKARGLSTWYIRGNQPGT
jgi:REP-associated tyrosine transposase